MSNVLPTETLYRSPSIGPEDTQSELSLTIEIKLEVKRLDRDTTSVEIPTDSTTNKINKEKKDY